MPAVRVPTPVMPVYDPDTYAEPIVPLEIFEALMLVRAAPLPDIAPLKVVAVIVLALKLPPASRATIVEAPLAEEAVVLALSIVPEEMLEALMADTLEPSPIK